MNDDRVVRIWAQVARQSQGAPVSVAHVCGAAMAEVTVMASPMARETVYATDGIAADLEELQLTLGEGPCMDAFSGGGPTLAIDLRAPEFQVRWPAFTPAAISSGAAAVFALPLQV